MVSSIVKSLWLIVAQTTRVAWALARGDVEAAGGHLRFLYLNLHEDLIKAVVAVQRWLPFWRPPGPDIDRILVVKLDRIGDMVTTTPALDALRERFPRAQIDMVGHPVALALLDGDPRVNERLSYVSWLYHPVRPALPGLRAWQLIAKLVWRRYPLVVYLRGSIPLLLLGLRSRVAATKYVVAEPVIDRYLNALRPLGGLVAAYPPRLHVRPENAALARQLLGKEEPGGGYPGPRVVIHAAASSAVKMWPPDRFAALADELARRFGARVHFLGAPSDRAVMETIGRLAAETHAYHWSLRLPQSVAVIAEADVFVGNDSGLSHIAAAVGTRAVVLWGPANLPMARPKASPADCLILYHDLPCRDRCLEFRCHNPSRLDCLMRTQMEDVAEAVARLLQRGGARVALPLAPAAVG
jgi:heptosyltransferase-2/heptosyltransferase-3